MNKEIEYYEFRYKRPKYKIKPPLDFSKYYQIHKDEIIIDLQQQNKKYKEVIDKLKEWINIVQQNKDNKHLEPFISTDELDELLDILKEVE